MGQLQAFPAQPRPHASASNRRSPRVQAAVGPDRTAARRASVPPGLGPRARPRYFESLELAAGAGLAVPLSAAFAAGFSAAFSPLLSPLFSPALLSPLAGLPLLCA